MDSMNTMVMILGYVMAPITGVVTYFATRKKQRNDFLQNQQESIESLTRANKEMVSEILNLRKEILQNSQIILDLRTENAIMKEQITSLSEQLRNVKTITKKYDNKNLD
jgi:peptidoglycan hydrolase CwlO-like protein